MEKGVDSVGVTIVFWCHDGEGNVVLSKRSENCRDEHGRWDCGSGALEFGLTPAETLKKEIREEYCTEVLDYEFLGYRDMKREHEGQDTHWLSLDFKVHIDPAQVDNGEPHKFEEVRFFPKDDLPSPLHSQLPDFLDEYEDVLRD